MANDKFIVTPVGTVGAYPYIQRPDTQFNDRGEYRIRLAIPFKKARKLMKEIEDCHAENMKELAKLPKYKGKRVKEGDMPFYHDEDSDLVIFTFKMYASFKDKSTGEMKELALRVYDSKGTRIENVPNISQNSEGRVEFKPFAYSPNGAVGASVKLQLSKFQLLKLVEWTGDNDTFGSDEDDDYEGGYVAPKKDSFSADEDDDEENTDSTVDEADDCEDEDEDF